MKAKDPYVFILVGLPLSGKSTWIRRNYPDAKVISTVLITIQKHLKMLTKKKLIEL